VAQQPFGQIPVLIDNGFSLFESRAIVRYLDAKSAKHPLIPSDPHKKALVDQWISVEQDNYNPPISSLVNEFIFKAWSGQQPDLANVEVQKKKLAAIVDVLDKHLEKNQYFIGNEVLSFQCNGHSYLSCSSRWQISLTCHIPNTSSKLQLLRSSPLDLISLPGGRESARDHHGRKPQEKYNSTCSLPPRPIKIPCINC
jgi:hypothetical protein